jgi:hypothetical protein
MKNQSAVETSALFRRLCDDHGLYTHLRQRQRGIHTFDVKGDGPDEIVAVVSSGCVRFWLLSTGGPSTSTGDPHDAVKHIRALLSH